MWKKFLGLVGVKRFNKLKRKVDKLEDSENVESISIEEKQILKVLNKKMTTSEIAKKLGKSRSRISSYLNGLEKKGKVKEVGKKCREVLYARK